jgi:hypothetical protein
MAVPSRKLIIDNLKTTLETITVANGYKSTVTKVEVLAKTWLQVSEVLRPWLGIVPQETRYEHLPAGRVRSVFRIDIIGHVSNGTYEEKRTRLADLLDDLWGALNVDLTRGANAVNTMIVKSETDEGAPEAEGTIVIGLDVVYMRTAGST